MATSMQQKLQSNGLEITSFWSPSPDVNALVVSNLVVFSWPAGVSLYQRWSKEGAVEGLGYQVVSEHS